MGGFILGQKVKQELPLSNNDTIKPKTWQKMTITEKASKKNELLKQGGMPRFLEYKDSISTDATNRREAEINKAASSRGMTRSEYERWYKKNEKKPDVPASGDNAISLKESRDSDSKITSKKGCGIAKEANRQNKKQIFR
jgi:hypothetical protein